MTVVAHPSQSRRPRWPMWPRSTAADAAPAEPDRVAASLTARPAPLPPRLQFARAVLVVIAVLTTTLLAQLTVVSGLQQRAAQERAFDRFRSELAEGTAPIGPTANDVILAAGTPVAYLEIPTIGLRQVVLEGTAPAVTFDGPGHRRDTPLPGQNGTSVVLGRRATYGGPFARIDELERNDAIVVTTGQGVFEFRVIGVRREGDPVPAPPASPTSRLLLATADGRPFLPDGVVRVDAQLVGDAVGGPERLVTAADLQPAEQIMAGDTSTLWALVLWLQLLIALALGAVWSWYRWGHPQTWIVFVPPLVLVGLAAAGEVARLLPNIA